MDGPAGRKFHSAYQKSTAKSYQPPKEYIKKMKPVQLEWRSESQLASIASKAASDTTPWIKQGKQYSTGMIGLHEEVKDCYNWIKPSAAEGRMRQKVIDEVTQIIKTLYPYVNVEVFGSFRTGLYLCSSDIDLVVFGKWPQLPLNTIGDACVQAKLCRFQDVKVVDKAFVPLLKLTMFESGAKVDISFNMVNGISNAVLIQSYVKLYPCLPPLFLLLKQFLVYRDLNEVYTGGVSSYALILMIVSFLQKHQRDHSKDGSEPNLGVLLLEFLEFYGRTFNYAQATICLLDGGSYISKKMMQQKMTPGHTPGMLSIEDPIQPGHDVCRSCYGALSMKQAFEYAFVHLQRAVLSNTKSEKTGMLHHILGVRADEVKFREWVNSQW